VGGSGVTFVVAAPPTGPRAIRVRAA
jgi:hypothetical protein